MRKLVAIAGMALMAVAAHAQTNAYTPGDYLRALAANFEKATYGPDKSPEKLKAVLAQTKALLPLAPNQACSNMALANIAVLHARMGDSSAAFEADAQITDSTLREKKKLELIFLTQSSEACVAALALLLTNPDITPENRLVYLEKVVNLAAEKGKKDAGLVNMSVNALMTIVITDKESKVAIPLLKLCQKARDAGTLKPDKFKDMLNAVLNTSQSAECIGKAHEMLETTKPGKAGGAY